MCVNREGIGKTAQAHLNLCDKYHNLKSWLIKSLASGKSAPLSSQLLFWKMTANISFRSDKLRVLIFNFLNI